LGGTFLEAGRLSVGADGALGAGDVTVVGNSRLANSSVGSVVLANDFILNAQLTVEPGLAGNSLVLSGNLVGTGALNTGTSAGMLALTGDNSGYSGQIAVGTGIIGVGSNTALGTNLLTMAIGSTGITALADGLNISNQIALRQTVLVDSGANTLTLSGLIRNDNPNVGGLDKRGAGTLVLTAANTYTGPTIVTEGTLQLDGSVVGSASVASGAALTGSGSVAGTLSVGAGGVLEPGNSPGTMVVGALILDPLSSINFELATPGVIGSGVNDLIAVNGDLTLDGTANIAVLPGFALGTHTLITYGGTLTDNGLSLVSGIPEIAFALIDPVTTPSSIQVSSSFVGSALFWDGGIVDSIGNGIVEGGAGTWNDTLANWTVSSGNFNLAWVPNVDATFSGTGGAVSVVGAKSVGDIDFTVDGYTLSGDAITLNNATTAIEVTTGTASISNNLLGAVDLQKTGAGNLVLSGSNAALTGVDLQAGTLSVVNNDSIGAGDVAMADGTTLALDVVSLGNNIAITGTGNIDALTGFSTLSGIIGGGAIVYDTSLSPVAGPDNTGVEAFGVNTYTGGTTIRNITLTIQADSGLGQAGSALAIDSAVLAAVNNDISMNRATTLTGGAGIAVETGTTLTMGGVISGTGSLEKTGGGTLALNAANTYAGNTFVTDGVLALGNNTAASSGSIQIENTSTLRLANGLNVANAVSLVAAGGIVDVAGGASQLSGIVSGTGPLQVIDSTGAPLAGRLTLSGVNTYTGGTSVTGTSVFINADSGLGDAAGDLTLTDAELAVASTFASARDVVLGGVFGQVEVGAASTLTLNGVVSGSQLRKTGAGTLVLNGVNTYTGGTLVNVGAVQVGDISALGTGLVQLQGTSSLIAGAADLVIENDVNVGGANTVDTQAFVFTLNGTIGGVGSITKQGSGTLVLNEANTYSGGTTLNQGTIVAGNNTALGTGDLSMAGNTFLVAGITPLTIANDINLLGGLATINNAGGTLALDGEIGGAGPLRLTSSVGTVVGGDAGSIALANGNSFTGGLEVVNTTVIVNADSAMGTALGAVRLENGVLQTTGDITTLRTFTLAGDFGRFDVADGTTLTLDGSVTGSAALEKFGDGTLALLVPNTYSGGTFLHDGTVEILAQTGLGTGDITFEGESTLRLLAGMTITKQITLNAAGTVQTLNGDSTISGLIQGEGSLTKTGPQQLTLTGVNTYDGGTFLNEGALRINNDSSIGTGTLTTQDGTTFVAGIGTLQTITLGNDIVFDSGTTTIDLVGTFGVVDSLTGGVNTNGTALTLNGQITGAGGWRTATDTAGTVFINSTNSYAGGTDLTATGVFIGADNALGTGLVTLNNFAAVQNNSGSTLNLVNDFQINASPTFSAVLGGDSNLTLSGAINGGGKLSKAGDGTLTVTGTSGFNGVFDVNEGGFVVATGATFGGAGLETNIRNGALLGGTGTITGTVNMANAAILSPGQSPGTLTVAGNLNLSSSTDLQWELGQAYALGGGLNDRVVVTGNLVLDGNLTVAESAGGAFTLGVYNLFSYGTLTDNGLTVLPLPGGFTGFVQNNTVASQINLIVTQPGTFVQYWDGADQTGNGTIDGGSGSWTTASFNWTGAAPSELNTNWQPNSVGVFQGESGTVQVVDDFTFQGLQFLVDGYTLADAGGSLTIGTPQSFIFTDTGVTTTIAAELTGAGQLLKQGAGNLVLSGANTYAGGTLLQLGAITVTNDDSIGTGTLTTVDGTTLFNGTAPNAGPVTLANNVVLGLGDFNINLQGTDGEINPDGTVTLDGNALTLDGIVSGTGTLNVTGFGFLTLNGANTYSGGTFITQAGVNVGTDTALGTGVVTISGVLGNISGALRTLENDFVIVDDMTVIGTSDITLNGVISGGSNLEKLGTTNLTLNGANTYTGQTNLNGGSITVGNNSALGTSRLDMANGTALIAGVDGLTLLNDVMLVAPLGDAMLGFKAVNTNGFTFTLDGVISGTGPLLKVGEGNLVLNGNNSYGGGTILANDTLTIGNNNALGLGQLTMLDETTLTAGVDGLSILNNIITLAGSTINTQGFTLTHNGQIFGAGNIIKTGEGTLVLNGANGYAGGTQLTDGIIVVGTNTALGGGALAMSDDTTLRAGVNGLTLANAISTAGAGTIDTQAFTFGLSGVISGAGSIIKVGEGILELNNSNSYAGGTELTDGTIVVGTNLSLGTGVLTMSGGTTLAAGESGINTGNNIVTLGIGTIDSGTGNYTLSGVISGAGSLLKVGEGTLALTNANSFDGLDITDGTVSVFTNTSAGIGGITMANNTTLEAGADNLVLANAIETLGAGTVNTNAFTFTLDGVISGAGSILKVGEGTLVLNGDNGYVGGTELLDGTIEIGADTALGTGVLTMSDGTTVVSGADDLVVANDVVLLGSGTFNTQDFTTTFNGVISDNAAAGAFVGQWQVDQGPTWNTSPPNGPLAYTGQEAAALLFGGNPGDYVISTVSNDPAQIDFMAWYSVIGFGSVAFAQDYSSKYLGQFYGPTVGYPSGDVNAPASAYVNDNATGPDFTNFAFTPGAGTPGVLVKTGTGNLVLNGNNTYSGGTALTEGKITVGSNTALGSGVLTMSNSTTLGAGANNLVLENDIVTLADGLLASNGFVFTLNGDISGAGSISHVTSGNLVLNGNNSFTNLGINVGTVTLGSDTAAGIGDIAIASNATLAANKNVTISNGVQTLGNGLIASNGNVFTLNGNVTGAGSISHVTSGNLVLNGNNSFTNLGINVGTVTLGSDTAAGIGDIAIASNATLAANKNVTISNGVQTLGNGLIASNGNVFTLNGNVTGAGSISHVTSGNLVLNGNNSFTNLGINLGTVTLGSNTAAGIGDIAIASDTTLAVNKNVTIGNDVQTLGNGLIASNGFVFTINGEVAGPGSISHVTSGNLVLNGNNSFTNLGINLGTVTLGSNTAAGIGDIALASDTTLAANKNVTIGNDVQTLGNGLIASNGFIFTINGEVAGPGSISHVTSGNLVLNGNNSFTNLGINLGTVTLGSNTAAGIGDIALASDTTLAANKNVTIGNDVQTLGNGLIASNGFIFTINGEVAGPGSISHVTSGNLVLNGNNSFTNLGINVGTVTLGSDTAAGIGDIAIASNATLAANKNVTISNGVQTLGNGLIASNGNVFTLNGNVTGAGSISHVTSGNLVLNGNNSFTNLGINAGTVTLGSNTAAGLGDIAIASNATLAANKNVTISNGVQTLGNGLIASNGNVFTLNGNVTGAGSISHVTSGNLVLNGNNSFTNLGINLGTVTLGSNTAAGLGEIAINDKATLAVNKNVTIQNRVITTADGLIATNGNTFTINAEITGAGSISHVTAGNLVLNGNNSFTNLGINLGTVTLGSNTAAGLGEIAINDKATLAVNKNVTIQNRVITTADGLIATNGNTFIINGQITGAGSISHVTAGNLVLNGNNSFINLGINVGRVTLGTNTAGGIGDIAINDLATLAAGANNLVISNTVFTTDRGFIDTGAFNLTLSGQIFGAGSLTKVGTGTLLLTRSSTYTGATTVQQGELKVNGSIASSAVTVQTGARLSGTGTVGSLVVQSGGTVAPGNSVGTLTVNGSATFQAGSTYAVEVTPTGADRITASGALSLAGTMAVAPTGTFTTFNQTFTVMSGSSRTGTFTTTGLSGFGAPFNAQVDYTATSVILRLAPASLVTLAGTPISPNALQVASAFDRAVAGGYNPQAFFNLYTQGANMKNALGQLSGEIHAAERRVAMEDTRVIRDTAFDRLNAGLSALGGSTQSASTKQGDAETTVWLRGVGSWGVAQADGVGSRFTTEQIGVLTGLDYAKDGFKVGAAFTYTQNDIEMAALGNARVKSTGGALYAGYRSATGLSLGVGGSVAGTRSTSNRAITVPGLHSRCAVRSVAPPTSCSANWPMTSPRAKRPRSRRSPATPMSTIAPMPLARRAASRRSMAPATPPTSR
jgi:autotransporter-associated beta strand protein